MTSLKNSTRPLTNDLEHTRGAVLHMTVLGADSTGALSCPYRGLAPFERIHAAYFFGREDEAYLIAANTITAGIVVLHGPSGVGKSSLLGAALPRALKRVLPDDPPLVFDVRRWDCGFYRTLLQRAKREGWVAYKRYGEEYRWSIKDRRRNEDVPYAPQAPSQMPVLQEQTFREFGRGKPTDEISLERLAELWAKGVGTPVLFIFDQFEQYFIGEGFGSNAEDARFEADLARIVKRRDLGVHVLISIREDALHELNRLRARIPDIQRYPVKLDYLDQISARKAIELPVAEWLKHHGPDRGPTSAAPELVDALIQQVSSIQQMSSRSGDCPRIETAYLQLALKRLWEEERHHGSPIMRLETLEDLGGASGIDKRHFLDTMRALPEDEQRLCAAIFALMVPPSGMKIALSADDLAKLASKETERVSNVLEKLANGPSRIINCVRSPKDNRAFLFEIFHDVLARPILDWIAAERERVQQQEKLEKQKREAEEERARQQAQLEQQRLEAEKEHARQQREIIREKQIKRRYRNLFIAAGFGFLLASVFAGVATYTYREAAQQKAVAIAMRANTAIDSGDNRLGLLASLAVLPGQEGVDQWFTRPITEEATQVLARSLYRPLGVTLKGHDKRLSQVAFSPDGSLIATASEDKSVRLWDAKTGGPLKDPSGSDIKLDHTDNVTSISFSAAQPLLATIAYDGTASVWDMKTRQGKQWRADSDNYSPHAVAISPDGETIITASYNANKATVWSWKGDTLTPLNAEPLTHEIGITSATFDGTGRLVMTTSLDRTARIWDLDSGKLVLELPKKSDAFLAGHDAPIRYAAFSRNGELVVTASGNKARIWRTCQRGGCETSLDPAARGKSALLRTLEGHRGQVTTASFDRSGERVITASADGTVRIWDVATGDALQILQGPKVVSGNRASAALSPDGRTVVAAFADNYAYLWNIDVQAEPMPCLPRKVTSVAASPDDRRIAAAVDGAVLLFDVSRLPASPGDQRIAAAFDDTVRISQRTCAREPDLNTPENTTQQAMSVAFGGDSRRLAVAAGDRVQLWDVKGNASQEAATFNGHKRLVLSVAFDPAGKRLVTGSQDKTARIWDLASRAPLGVLKGHDAAVFSAAFSSDGRKVATGSFDKTVRLWDAATGDQLGVPIDAKKPVLAVTFTSDDKYLVTTLLDDPTKARPFRTSIAMWNVQTGSRASEQEVGSLRLADYLAIYSQDAGILFSKGIAMLPRNRDAIRNVVGSAGGVGVYTVSLDGEVRMWRLPPSEPHRLIRYAREVALPELPEELRSLSEEECRELGLSCAQSAGWAETVYRSFLLPVEGLLQVTAVIIDRLRSSFTLFLPEATALARP